MANRQRRYFPNRPDPHEEDEGDDQDEEEEEEFDEDAIEVDSPEEDDEDDEEFRRSPDFGPEPDEILDEVMDDFVGGEHEDRVDDHGRIEDRHRHHHEHLDADDDDDDAMTWESRSTVSDAEPPPDADEWYPLPDRKTPLPNFALPTSTRSSFLPPDQRMSGQPPVDSDDDECASDEDDAEFQEYEEVMRPNPNRRELSEMVLDYFLHYGHADVIETFCKEANLPIPEEAIAQMNVRNQVKAMILEGKMEETIAKLEEISESILKDSWVNFVVRKQHIIEMVRAGKTIEPVQYFRTHLMVDGKRPCDERMEVLEKIFTLMVFSEGETSEFHCYYDQSEREQTAREVNSAILFALGKPKSSRIDMIGKAMVFMKTEMHNSTHPNKLTTEDTAKILFGTPFGYQEAVEDALKRRPLDLTEDLC